MVDVITPIWFVSCDSRYMSISICHEMSQVGKFYKDMKTYLPTIEERIFIILNLLFQLRFEDSDHGNFSCLGYCSEPNPKCKIL